MFKSVNPGAFHWILCSRIFSCSRRHRHARNVKIHSVVCIAVVSRAMRVHGLGDLFPLPAFSAVMPYRTRKIFGILFPFALFNF